MPNPPTGNQLSEGERTLRKRSLARITVEDHPYDRGYWRRYAGEPRPHDKGEARDGWDDCNAELSPAGRAALSPDSPR